MACGLLFAGWAKAQTPPNPYSYSQTTSYTYYTDTGFLASQTQEPSNPQNCVVMSYGYDAAGNRVSTTSANCGGAPSAAQFPTHQASQDFTSPASQTISVNGASKPVSYVPNLFPSATTVTASASQQLKETRLYDPRFGSVLQLTGANQITTNWKVDDFGRQVFEQLPDGTSVVTYYCVVAWNLDKSANTPGCPAPSAAEIPADAVAFIHSEAHDTSGAKMGPFTRVYVDRLGRQIRKATESFDGANQPSSLRGAVIVQDTNYSAYGVKVLETQPYFLATKSSTTSGSGDAGAELTVYDALGRPTAQYVADPNGQAGTQVFGALGNRTASKTSYVYSGLTLQIVNDKGQTRVEERNALGEVIRVTDATGAQLAHQHDAFGNLVATKDALQNVISLSFDIRGHKVLLSDPDSGTTQYCYDAFGDLTATQNANMRGSGAVGACPSAPNTNSTALAVPGWTTYAYDMLGRAVQRIEPENQSAWAYDSCSGGKGKLCQVTNSNGSSAQVVYDGIGRPINTARVVGSGTDGIFASAVSYDATTGRVVDETYPTGLRVGYSYTSRGFLEKLTLKTPVKVNPLPTTPGGPSGASMVFAAGSVLWQRQAVNAWGDSEQELLGNGVATKTAFESATGRPTDVQAGTNGNAAVLNQHYVWDSLNNLTARNDANGDGNTGAVTESFNYADGLNRLTSYTVSAPDIPNLARTVTLQYNALGMLLYKSDVGNYTYGSQGNGASHPHALMSVAGAVNVTNLYDANGNLVSASSGKYTNISYSSFNLPWGSTGLSGPGGSPVYNWLYDEGHARLKETRTIASGTYAGTRTTWYLHPDAEGGLGFEFEDNRPASPSAANPAVKSSRHFLTAAGRVVAVLVSTGDLPSMNAGQTAPPSPSMGTDGNFQAVKLEFWHQDQLGSLVTTTDHAGAVTQRYAYDPFGKRRYTDGRYDSYGNLVIDWSPAVSNGTGRGYSGHEQLDDVGLVHMNGRMFDPTLGVFIQADPHVTDPYDLQNYNRYGYCLNNPMSCTDPSGFDDCMDDGFCTWSSVTVDTGGLDGVTTVTVTGNPYWSDGSTSDGSGSGSGGGGDFSISAGGGSGFGTSPTAGAPWTSGGSWGAGGDGLTYGSSDYLTQISNEINQAVQNNMTAPFQQNLFPQPSLGSIHLPPQAAPSQPVGHLLPKPSPVVNPPVLVRLPATAVATPAMQSTLPNASPSTVGFGTVAADAAIGAIPVVGGAVFAANDIANGHYWAAAFDAGTVIVDFASFGIGGDLLREAKVGARVMGEVCSAGGCRIASQGCFVAGTPVLTPDGVKPIEQVQVGELVAARDETTGLTSWRPVVRLIRPPAQEIVWVTYVNPKGEQETIGATLEHPFRVVGRGWVGAGALAAGDQLESLDVTSVLRVVKVEHGRQPRATYNLEIDSDHSYFVGKQGAWVHNACSAAVGAAEEAANQVKAVRNAHLAGDVHPKTGVPFDKDGFPDFSSVTKVEVQIEQTGTRAGDFRRANDAAGLERTPEGYTWHHHQDGTTMQLVPRDIHAQTGHTGGFNPGP
jgi:RHS repeat-associated protein